MTTPAPHDSNEVTQVSIFLTAKQIWRMSEPDDAGVLPDFVITQVDSQGGIFLVQAQDAGEEGAGFWLDAEGTEHVDAFDQPFAELDDEQHDQWAKEKAAGHDIEAQ